MANPSRRAVLGAGVFVAAAGVGVTLGFDPSIHHKVAVPPPPPPATLAAALSGHRQLLAVCDAALAVDTAAAPKLTSLRGDLAAHADALEAVLETYPGWRYEQGIASSSSSLSTSPAPDSSPPVATAPTVATVSVAVQHQADQLTAACVGWPLAAAESGAQTTVVPLLGSIAACLTVHTGLLA